MKVIIFDQIIFKNVLTILEKEPENRSNAEIQLIISNLSDLPFFNYYSKQDNGAFIIQQCCKYMVLSNIKAQEYAFLIGNKYYQYYLDGRKIL